MSLMSDNPQVRYFESRLHGYIVCDVDSERWHTVYYAVDRGVRNNPKRQVLASYEVISGIPGPKAVQSAEN